METTAAIPEAWYTGCHALRELLAGRLDRHTTVAARDVVWAILERLRRNESLNDLRIDYTGAGRWLRVARPFCREESTARQLVLAAFAARLMEFVWGRELPSLESLPRPLLSEFVVSNDLR